MKFFRSGTIDGTSSSQEIKNNKKQEVSFKNENNRFEKKFKKVLDFVQFLNFEF